MKKRQAVKGRGKQLQEYAVMLYICFIFGIFPFWIHKGFLDISKTKSVVFVAATTGMVVVCLVGALIFRDWKWCRKKENIYFGLALILLFVINFHSEYSGIAMWGEKGRYQGTVIYLAYCFAGICILNFGNFRRIYLPILIVSGAIVSMIGILNFYEIDLLGSLRMIAEHQRHEYLSTIGQMDTFAAFLSVSVPLTVVKAVWETGTRKRILWYVCCVAGFWGVFASTCDSVYLTLGVLAVVLPFFCVGSNERMRHCVEVCSLFVGSLLTCQGCNYILKYPLEYVDGILSDFLLPKRLVILVMGVVLLWILYLLLGKRIFGIEEKRARWLWLVISAVVLGFAAWKYVSMTTFDEQWGSHRGFIWKQGLEFFMRQPWDNQLLGIGMDCVIPTFHGFFGSEATLVQGSAYYNNLHNEYLQYLVTTGILGLLAYVAAFGGGIAGNLWKGIKYGDGERIAIGIAGLCYAVQAVVNISMSSVTGIIIVLLIVGLVIDQERMGKEKL